MIDFQEVNKKEVAVRQSENSANEMMGKYRPEICENHPVGKGVH